MTLAPQRSSASRPGTAGAEEPTVLSPGAGSRREGPGALPWVMGTAVAVAVAGAAFGFNGVLRGWAWYSPVFSTVLAVAFSMAMLRSLRARTWLVAAGGLVALVVSLTFIFFRQHSIAGFIPSPETMTYLGKFLRRASETVLAESTPVAPNAGIVMLICAVLGLLVILIDALAFPLALPATSGLGILAILVVPAIVKPQSVGVLGFVGAAIGYLLILGCSHWFTPDARTLADTARNPGQLRRGAVTAAAALTVTLLLQPVIPGFDQGTFPQGSRLNPFGSATGLNPMISLGNSLRSPSGDGRITFATNAPTTPYLRSVTVDSFDGDSWSPDDRESTRQPGTGRIESGLDTAATEFRIITAVNTGQYTSPYLPSPYAPESVNGLTGRWSWDPATLSIKGIDTNSRDQQYVVTSVTPQLTAALLARASDPVRGVPEQFLREPSNVPEVVRSTAKTVTAGAATPYARAMAIQRYLRSTEFSYSLQSPVQGGYDGNGLSVLADFLAQKSGYCIHFASAMAVMARLEGIPSRIAVGYAPGRPTGATVAVSGQGPLPEFEVDARDAHAWPELYFQGVGWVPFEPTPSRGVVPAYATEAAAPSGASTNERNDALTPGDGSTQAPVPAPGAVPLPGTGTPAAGGGYSAQALYGLGAVLLLALIVASPRLVRGGVRRRRLRTAARGYPGTAGTALPAWVELRDLAMDYGVAPGASETPRHFSARLRASAALGEPGVTDGPGQRAAAALTEDFEREQYGRPGAAGSADDAGSADPADSAAARIALVQAALRSNAGPLVRLRAAWLPPSVMSGWRRALSLPGRAISRTAQRTRRGLAGSWGKIRNSVRRVRRG
ncbi:transglutaminaseTgpA domain-containing protein [Arthrobacter sp. NPDC058130]|uniref:transglutaminase family protein n=1 Tax=Arthrobacter sp. NPDC058130 TaxID=3346353 RepID=UPI0036F15B9A